MDRLNRVAELFTECLGCDEEAARTYTRRLLEEPVAPSHPGSSGGGPQPAAAGRPVAQDGAGGGRRTAAGDGPDGRESLAAVSRAPSPVGLARLLHDQVGPHGASAVLLAAIDRQGELRMSGVAGTSAREADTRSRIPLRCVLPLARTAPEDQLLWIDDDSGDRILAWVSSRSGPSSPYGGRADGRHGRSPGERLLCVVIVVWPAGPPLEQAVRQRTEELTGSAGRRLCGLADRGLPEENLRAPWLAAVLDVIPIPAALLFPVRDARGRVVAFNIDRCNGHATDLLGRTPGQITGGRLLEALPGLAHAGIFDAYVKVLETGRPLHRDPFSCEEPFRGVRYPAVLSVRAQRIGGGLLVSWQFHDEQARMAARIDDAERLVDLAWAEWNLITGEITWSRRMYDIFDLDPALGPLSLDRLSQHIGENDLPVLTRAVQTLCEQREPVTFEVRTRHADPPRHVRVTAELVRDSLGNLIAVHGVVQDVSAARRMEAALEASRCEAERHRLRMAEELQLALLPRQHNTLPGLSMALRYQPAEDSARIGGDWFEATPLPDGRVLIAIGDVSGHGLLAAAGMAQLRHALLGIAHTGADAARILDCLNLVACHSHEETVMATAIVGHFHPHDRTLAWARGGHPPPVLVRAGQARELHNADGISLGATLDPGYRLETVRLQPGDRVILYTDGLVERRDDRRDERSALLLDAARQGARGGPEEHLQTLLSTLDTNPEDDTCVIVLHVRK
ncbi:PP2C family protein-serine/threonine phosphatase [Streptomyces poonensis]|uniref:Transcription antitermination regulator n=1 Tax=Streptomyces poonensis TaxID=68255 RepID=A0A918PFG7_9ACTN|nr:SpoIIE family protein phosphatase [Streptomyces poonensis]GGZ03895.1 transcription antitermination regulator [Streptomyces poonensis]GLJ90789.1 transcription antitermination regulator [Streptomyces poonensis]